MRKLALIFVPVLLIACGREPAAVRPNGLGDQPSFNFTKGPDSPGPIVFRFQAELGVFHADVARGLSAIYGGDVVEFCNTGGTTFPLVDVQHVTPPQNPDRIIEILQGNDVETTVWPFAVFDCALFTTTTPLATGTVHFLNTDNDLIVFLRDHNNANAFGWTAQGTLTRSNGSKAAFNGVDKVVWDGVDGTKIFKETSLINLR